LKASLLVKASDCVAPPAEIAIGVWRHICMKTNAIMMQQTYFQSIISHRETGGLINYALHPAGVFDRSMPRRAESSDERSCSDGAISFGYCWRYLVRLQCA
jgi:hypothetical protein